ncbi:MAG: hypothetical protein DMG79_02270, partial [Acidobacteria bacterium]
GSGGSKENTGGSSRKGANDLPSGLYVGSTAAKASPVAGNAKSASEPVNPNLTASVRPPRVGGAPARPMQADSASTLSEAERGVFGNR